MESTLPRLSDLTRDQLQQHRSIDFARWVCAQAATGGSGVDAAAAFYLEHWPRTFSADLVRKSLELDTKAAVAVGNTTDTTWALPLVSPKPLTDAFLQIVRPQEIVGQLVGVRRVPVNTPIPVWNPTSPSSAKWVAQGAMKPIAAFAFGSATLTPAKIQCSCVVTKELLKLSVPGSEGALRDILAFQVVLGTNEEFIIPARVAVANTNPGSVTNAGTLVTTANDPALDAKAVLTALVAARPQVTNPTLIMNVDAASALIATDKHRDLALTGGIAFGAQVIVSPAAGKTIAAIDPSAVLLNDQGVEIDSSQQASILLDSAPAVPDATTVYASLFQLNMVALRAERFVTWKLTAATACQYSTRA